VNIHGEHIKKEEDGLNCLDCISIGSFFVSSKRKRVKEEDKKQNTKRMENAKIIEVCMYGIIKTM
jgi:hypothetical protein